MRCGHIPVRHVRNCFIYIFQLKLSELNFSGPTLRIRAPKRNTKQRNAKKPVP